jgi:hypothetical protein
MLALVTTAAKHPHPMGKLLQIARHRVVRWFRPPEAELRRHRTEPCPHPTIVAPGSIPKTENGHDRLA